MKVTQKKLDDGRLLIDAVASTAEVSNALNNAHLAFAQQMGMRPEKDKTVAQAAEERMGIKDLDSVVMNQAVEALVPASSPRSRRSPSPRRRSSAARRSSSACTSRRSRTTS